jgi:CheY-like chemotaxis protein
MACVLFQTKRAAEDITGMMGPGVPIGDVCARALGQRLAKLRVKDSTMAKGEFVLLVDARGPRRVSTPLLVVEDDPQLRSMVALLLKDEGYPVVALEDGLDAITWLQKRRPSLVILDLNLPHVNGDEVGAKIRARYGRALPIVLVTANRSGAEIADSLGAEYLPKPFDVDELLAVVWRTLAQA